MNKIINLMDDIIKKSILSFWQWLFFLGLILHASKDMYKKTDFIDFISKENVNYLLYILNEFFAVYVLMIIIFLIICIICLIIHLLRTYNTDDNIKEGIETKTVGFWNELNVIKRYFDFPYTLGTKYFSFYFFVSEVFMSINSPYHFSEAVISSNVFQCILLFVFMTNFIELVFKILVKAFYVEFTYEKDEISNSDYLRSIILKENSDIVLCRLSKNSQKYYILESDKKTPVKYKVILSTNNFDEAVYKYENYKI